MATEAPEIQRVSDDDPRLKKDFGAIGLLFAAIGSIIGSGWLFSSLHAAQDAGPAAILSWVIGTIMFLLIGLSYAELGVMFPRSLSLGPACGVSPYGVCQRILPVLRSYAVIVLQGGVMI